MSRGSTAFPLLVLLAGAAIPQASAQPKGADLHTVIKTDGKRRAGKITAEKATGVTIEVGGKAETISREEIARIEYRDRPSGFSKGDRLMNTNAAEAAEAYMAAANSAPPLFKPHGLYFAGRAYLRAGKYDKAAEAFAGAVKADPAGWYLREATREAVRSHIRGGSAPEGLQLADAATASFKSAGLPDDEAQLLKAEALEATGSNKQAYDIYCKVMVSRDPYLAAAGELGRARGDLAQGGQSSMRDAEERFKKLAAKEDVARSVRAGAARGVADCIMKSSGAKTDPLKLRQAAAAYAEALSVHFPGPDDATTDREAALVGAAEVYDALAALAKAKGDPGKAAFDRYTALAKAMRDELTALYGAPSAAAPGKTE